MVIISNLPLIIFVINIDFEIETTFVIAIESPVFVEAAQIMHL
jgi:hypothetical protein